MNLLKKVIFLLVMFAAVAAYGADPEVQRDLLMAKITNLLKAGKAADALPYFAQLEGMELTLSKPLPESFQFFYIDTLDKAGDDVGALDRANSYLDKIGKKGKHYSEVVDIVSRLQVESDKRTQAGFKFYKDVVQDTRTGLMWVRNVKDSDPIQLTNWAAAMKHVKTLDIGGYRDWRLPTKEEFEAFLKRGGSKPDKWFEALGFRNTGVSYWSSSAKPVWYKAEELEEGGLFIDSAWSSRVTDGSGVYAPTDCWYGVWAVRTANSDVDPN